MTKTKNSNKSNLRSARSESISNDELERSVYSPIANMKGSNILEPGDETQTSFEYLKNNTEMFFLVYEDIFDSD